jgi:uncharacterized protein YchJ
MTNNQNLKPRKRMVTFIPGDGRPLYSQKTGRNNICRCGSGLKAKRCCGTETKLFKPKHIDHGTEQKND